LKVGTNVLPSVAKKKVDAAMTSASSTEAFPTAGLALELEVPTAAATIRGSKVGEECWNSCLDDRLEEMAASIHVEAVAASIQLEVAVVTTSKPARLRETLPAASWVLLLKQRAIFSHASIFS
jgi:hypothetical protein